MKNKKELNIADLKNVSGAGYDRNTNEKPDGDNGGRMVRERNNANLISGSMIYTNW